MPSGNLKQRFPLQSRLQANQSKKHPEKKRSVPLPGRSLFFLQNSLFLYNANSTADPRQSPAAKWQTNFHRWQNWTSKPKRKKGSYISSREQDIENPEDYVLRNTPGYIISVRYICLFSITGTAFPFKSTKRIRILWVQNSPP